jgi:hypothetical protein
MSGSSSQTPAVTTQTKDPWAPAQPYLQQAMAAGSELYGSGTGYRPYNEQTQAPLSDPSVQGLAWQQTLNTANPYGFPTTQAALGTAQDVISSQGMTPGIQGAADQYQDLYNKASSPDNPYLQAQLDAQNRLIADKVNSATSGMGRYGSAAHTDVLTRALSETDAPVLAQDYARRQQEMLAATQGQAGVYQQGLSQAGQYSQLLPSLQQLQYLPAQNEMAVGSIYDQRAQAQLNDQIKLYNAQQSYPWEQLSRFNAVLQGVGGLGGQQVTSSTPYQAPFAQRLLGGAVAGGGLGSIFGPVGTGVGALGGAALGGYG